MHTNEWPARRCSGPCEGGDRDCETPDACRIDEDHRDVAIAFGCFLVPAVVLALLLLAWLVATVLRVA